ncbi:MAG: 50S ribosomal protein L3 N(5)-glutamine methyltransferase [Opitutae bacterium]|nr:50S ribosomal protein L3 N(5)-glutamine methyltransferase [Opitutae bacterium]MCD8298947.1 50S ribosomal protein L3 N(5)-glutamine methyltransferase [Opitutae bacterium]
MKNQHAAAEKFAAEKKKIFDGCEVLTTMRDWVRFAVSLFRRKNLSFGQGTATAYDDALYLVQSALDLPLDGPETFFDARLTANEISRVKDFIARRALERVPAAYITREAWLGECRFYVDERVIVPRSYIAEMIPEKIAPWLGDVELVARAADVCTGGGSLAILLALAFPNARVDACDISSPALEVAAKNVGDYGLDDRISLFNSDVLAGVPAEKNSYDLIISNPPYEPDSIRENLPEEFRSEPAEALFSGADGMGVIRKLLRAAAEKLKPAGVLVVEVGGLQGALEAEFPQIEFNWLETEDASDCVCLIQASSLKKAFAKKSRGKGAAR